MHDWRSMSKTVHEALTVKTCQNHAAAAASLSGTQGTQSLQPPHHGSCIPRFVLAGVKCCHYCKFNLLTQ